MQWAGWWVRNSIDIPFQPLYEYLNYDASRIRQDEFGTYFATNLASINIDGPANITQ